MTSVTADAQQNARWIAGWLTVCAITILGMILLGGVTRLTESGLSMVDWRPIMGIIPPLTEAQWLDTFAAYQQYPEYQKLNQGMDLAGFKQIFWFEYLHRVLGRLIGLMYFVPLVIFAMRRMITPQLLPTLILLLTLGAAQGLLGWYMVQSGLVDRPSVSQYRLTAHLGVAVAIYALMIWLILRVGSDRSPSLKAIPPIGWVLLIGVYTLILSGGFMAGTDAGFAYPTWPLMGETFVPLGYYAEGWQATFEGVATIHFNHRMLAYALALLVLVVSIKSLRQSDYLPVRRGAGCMLLALTFQVGLGIGTVLTQVAIPMAATHQVGAVLLLTAVLYWIHAQTDQKLVISA
jgi:cytochrome c oxidase assembly protein subunit 15